MVSIGYKSKHSLNYIEIDRKQNSLSANTIDHDRKYTFTVYYTNLF